MALTTVQVECPAAATTALPLPGTAGSADADMIVTFYGNSDLHVEFSADGVQYTEYSASSAGMFFQGFQLQIARGMFIRARNTHAGTTHTAILCYRYLGSPL